MSQVFDDLRFSDAVLRGIYSYGFAKPSEIQWRAARPLIQGRDLVLVSEAGSGKTAVCCLGALEAVDARAPHLQALFVCPSRELAEGTRNLLLALGDFAAVGCHCCGPSAPSPPAATHIATGEPDRLLDLVRQSPDSVKRMRLLVIDGACELLARGFGPGILQLHALLPPDTQVVLTAATLNDELSELTAKLTSKPLTIVAPPQHATERPSEPGPSSLAAPSVPLVGPAVAAGEGDEEVALDPAVDFDFVSSHSPERVSVKNASARAGLLFPAGRIHSELKRSLVERGGEPSRVSLGASVFLAAVLEYLTAEVVELAAGAASRLHEREITPSHIAAALGGDPLLHRLCGGLPALQGSLEVGRAEVSLRAAAPPAVGVDAVDAMVLETKDNPEQRRPSLRLHFCAEAVLRRINPGVGVCESARCTLDELIGEWWSLIELRAVAHCREFGDGRCSGQPVLAACHVSAATRSILTGELAEHAEAEGNKAVTNLVMSLQR